jgi:hypothetical protein
MWLATKEGQWTRTIDPFTGTDPIGFAIDQLDWYDSWRAKNYPSGSSDGNWYKWSSEYQGNDVWIVALVSGGATGADYTYQCTVTKDGDNYKISGEEDRH